MITGAGAGAGMKKKKKEKGMIDKGGTLKESQVCYIEGCLRGRERAGKRREEKKEKGKRNE